MAVAMSHGSAPRSDWGPRAALVSERSESLSTDSSSFPWPFLGEPLLSCAVQSPFLPGGGGGFDDGDCRGGFDVGDSLVKKAMAESKVGSPGCGKSWPVVGLDEICAEANTAAASRDIAGTMIASCSPMKTKAGVVSGAPGLRTYSVVGACMKTMVCAARPLPGHTRTQ